MSSKDHSQQDRFFLFLNNADGYRFSNTQKIVIRSMQGNSAERESMKRTTCAQAVSLGYHSSGPRASAGCSSPHCAKEHFSNGPGRPPLPAAPGRGEPSAILLGVVRPLWPPPKGDPGSLTAAALRAFRDPKLLLDRRVGASAEDVAAAAAAAAEVEGEAEAAASAEGMRK